MTFSSGQDLQRAIDRVVDGDANKEETRTLVAGLDRHTDGWKRLAVTFLEARSWQQTFAEIVQPAVSNPADNAGIVPPSRTARRFQLITTIAAVAIAFMAGIGATMSWMRSMPQPSAPDDNIVRNLPVEKAEIPVVRNIPRVNGNEPRVVGIVNISNGDVTEAAFPLVATPDKEFVTIDLQPKGLNDYTVRLWERKGYRIEQHRKLVDVKLADGHRFQFPIDWVQPRYVGERIY